MLRDRVPPLFPPPFALVSALDLVVESPLDTVVKMLELTDKIPLDHPVRSHPEKYNHRSLGQVDQYPYMVPSKCEAKWGVYVRFESEENRGVSNKSKSLFFLS